MIHEVFIALKFVIHQQSPQTDLLFFKLAYFTANGLCVTIGNEMNSP